jgi:uncharacterized repeat protein (TIGR01451 family)
MLAGSSPARAEFTTPGAVIVRGGYEVTGNALMKCSSGTSCANNTTQLVPVDADPLAMGDLDGNGTDDTTMSASGTIAIPAGAKVVSATLFYSANGSTGSNNDYTGAPWAPTTPANAPLLFGKTGGKYTQVLPQSLVQLAETGAVGLLFQGKYDVTALFSGSGEYWVANGVSAPSTHPYNRDALWVLVVLYEDGSAPRFIQTYDGIYHCGDSTSTLTLNNFQTPATGPIDARFTIWGQDGHPTVSGESIKVGTTFLSNALNSSNNVGNGTMSSAAGVALTRTPNAKVHAEPPDLDTFDASGALTNSQTSVAVELTCSANDGVFWLGSVLSMAVVAPEIVVTKTVTDVNGGQAVSKDELRYEITVENKSGDSAIDVVLADPIPANTTFVPGSIEIEDTPGVYTAKTDAAGDDVADFADDRVVVRLGTGATATAGGSLAVGAKTKVRFRVALGASAGPVTNSASVRVRAASGGPAGPILTTLSDTALLDGVRCFADGAAAIDPGCTATAPACQGTGAAATCVACIEARHCGGGTCNDGACQPQSAPPVDSGVIPLGDASPSPAPASDESCSCSLTPGVDASSGGLLAGVAAVAAALLARARGRRRC